MSEVYKDIIKEKIVIIKLPNGKVKKYAKTTKKTIKVNKGKTSFLGNEQK